MKLLTILQNYRKGARLSSLFLVVLMSWSLFQGIFVYGRYQNQITNTAIFKSAETDNAYYLQFFLNAGDMLEDLDIKAAEKAVEALRQNSQVKYVFTIQYAAPFPYNSTNTSIILYDPEMLEFFPKLKNIGIDFSQNPDGVILGSDLFSDLKVGEQIDYGTCAFPISGKLSNPYAIMAFNTASSQMSVNNLFHAAGDSVIMQATDTVVAQLEATKCRMQISSNFVVVFRDGVSLEEQEAILNTDAPKHVPVSFDQILENTEPSMKKALAQEIARPLFLAIASMIAFLSILILTFKKKEKEMAIWYVCGGSSKKCGLVNFLYFGILALIPVLLNVALIMYWPHINWVAVNKLIVSMDLQEKLSEANYIKLLGSISYFRSRFKVDNNCLSIVYIYYGVSILIALGATVGSMRKHSPLTYLRGVGK